MRWRHLATDGKAGLSRQMRFGREGTQTGILGPGISGSVVRAIQDRLTGCGGHFRVCCEGSRSEKTEKWWLFDRRWTTACEG
jgi:hypothetical protein